MAEKRKKKKLKKKKGGDACHIIIEISDHKMEYHDLSKPWLKMVGAALDR